MSGGSIVGASDAVDIYSSDGGTWSTASLSAPRGDITPASMGKLAIFAGGGNPETGVSETVDLYDSATGQWSTTSLPNDVGDMSVTALGPQVMFAGGDVLIDSTLGQWGATSGDVEAFNVETGAWTTGLLSRPRDTMTAVSVGATAIFAGGTTSYDPTSYSNAVDLFTALPPVTGSIARGARGSLRVTIQNTSNAALPANDIVQIYASNSPSDRGAVLLGSVTLGNSLAAGASTVVSVPISLPSDLAAGSYHLFAAMAPPTRGQVTIFATYANAFTIAGADVAASGLPRAGSANRAGLPFSVTPLADGDDSTVSELGSAGANILE